MPQRILSHVITGLLKYFAADPNLSIVFLDCRTIKKIDDATGQKQGGMSKVDQVARLLSWRSVHTVNEMN